MPSPETIDYVHLDRICRRELRLHDFKFREFCVLSLILDHSYAIARPEAFFQTQDQIGALTRISKGNVSGILSEMESVGVLRIRRGLGRYTFNPDASSWRVRPTFKSDAERRAADRLEAMLRDLNATSPEQLHLLPPLPDLDALIIEEARLSVSSTPIPGVPGAVSRGAASLDRGGDQSDISDEEPASGRRGDLDASPAAPPPGDHLSARERVNLLIAGSLGISPESGSQIGNPVPKLGTPHINAFNRDANASHLNASYMPPVPKSGTKRRRTALESELLEALEAVTSREEMKQNGGWWTIQIRQHASLVREAISDLRLRQIDQNLKPILKPGGWLRKHYERLVRNIHQNS